MNEPIHNPNKNIPFGYNRTNGDNRTNGAVYFKINIKVEICSAL